MGLFKKKDQFNFLDHYSFDKKDTKKKAIYLRFRILIYLIILAIVILIIASIPYFTTLKDIYNQGMETADNLKLAKQYLSEEQFNELGQVLLQSNLDFQTIMEMLKEFDFFEKIPVLENDYFAANQLLRSIILSTSALNKLSFFVDETNKAIGKDPSIGIGDLNEEQKKDLMKIIYESAPFLQGIKAELDLAIISLNQINQIGRYEALEEFIPIEKINFVQELIDDIVPLAQPLAIASGYPQEQTYLILLQNNSELRPTGGFIGTYGIMKVRDGSIISIETDDIYNLDKNMATHIEPPEPIKKYMRRDEWLLRDANWDPDFAITGKRVIDFYNLEGGEEQIDGVIAITPIFIEYLLDLVGPVYVEGVEFKTEDFVKTLEYEVEMNYYKKGAVGNRKDIIGVLTKALIERLFQIPKENWIELGRAIEDSLKQKQILVYFVNPGMQHVFSASNWTGEMKDYYGDYVMLVDANLAALKTDLVMQKDLSYTVYQNEDNDLIAKFKIQYTNTGDFSWWSTRYRTYTRLYVPQGSRLIRASGMMENDKIQGGGEGQVDIYNEHGKTVFGAFISIEPKQTGELVFEYQLPDYIKEFYYRDLYNLYVQKQPGTYANPISISIDFNDKIKEYYSEDPSVEVVDKRKIRWETELIEDKELRIGF